MSTRSIITPLTRVLPSLRTPLVLGAMAGAAGGNLAAAVSKAGGFGFIGAGTYDAPKLQSEVEKAYQGLSITRGALVSGRKRANFGIGLLVWKLTAMNDGKPPSAGPPKQKVMDLLEVMVSARPRAIWLTFGEEEDIVGWKKIVQELDRKHCADLEGVEEERVKWFGMIGREDELAGVVERIGCDVLIVQGCESGGHGHSQSPPLSALLADVLRALPGLKPNNATGTTPVVIGAGGLADGKSLAALLAAGCDGGVFGTRFVMTPESVYTQEQKEVMVKAKSSQTKRTMAMDDARGTLGWPKGVDGRGLVNKTVEDYEKDMREEHKAGKVDPEGNKRRMKRYDEAAKKGDADRLVTWAGTGVGAMDSIKPAGQLVEEITNQTIEALNRVKSFVQ